jgi:hypothetical protein
VTKDLHSRPNGAVLKTITCRAAGRLLQSLPRSGLILLLVDRLGGLAKGEFDYRKGERSALVAALQGSQPR